MTDFSQAAAAIQDKAQALLDVLDMNVALEASTDDDKIYLNVTGDDSEYFLNHRGEALKNLTFLLKTYQDAAFPELDLEIKFDAAGYLAGKEKELRAMAADAREQLREPGDEVSLEPLNPYDRRIVHMALAEYGDVDTESVGEGHFKRLLIRKTAG